MAATHEAQAWRPSANINSLKDRAAIIAQIRAFFDARGAYEVETPALSRGTITDPYIDALSVKADIFGESSLRYLQSSPEYAMKRLLAAGSGDIYQICKAFRDDEVGQYHNPEFTILEWYRLGYDMQALIDEVADLLTLLFNINSIEQATYQHLFMQHCGLDPIIASHSEVVEYALDKTHDDKRGSGHHDYIIDLQNQIPDPALLRDSVLQYLFCCYIEPLIGQVKPIVVTHYPAAQSALATLSEDTLFANRFEVYFRNIELANGFNELTDAEQQLARFKQDNIKRTRLGKPQKPIDKAFIDALNHGLPACSGVALGIDRLIMLLLHKDHINKVMSFNNDNC